MGGLRVSHYHLYLNLPVLLYLYPIQNGILSDFLYMAFISCGASSLVAGIIVATSLLTTSFPISKPGIYNLLFRRWLRLEIERMALLQRPWFLYPAHRRTL
jgi:hypothetical protein